jgi:hypothetical protein
MMMPEQWYQKLDAGIRFAVRVLHAAGGVETCQSCQGGDGHSYPEPTVDLIAGPSDALGFLALAALHAYALPVASVALVWNVQHGLPYERVWRVTFSAVAPERANEVPVFVNSYRATSPKPRANKKAGKR